MNVLEERDADLVEAELDLELVGIELDLELDVEVDIDYSARVINHIGTRHPAPVH